MASAIQRPHTHDEHQRPAQNKGDNTLQRNAKQAEQRARPLLSFWTKINNDWIFDLSGELAYNFLLSIFPILLVIFGVTGFILGSISPTSLTQLDNGIANALPSGAGKTIVNAVIGNLSKSAGALLILGLVSAFFTGSRLFITLEKHFGVIFRLRSRNPIRQNLMAFGMMLLYLILIPIALLASVVSSALGGIVNSVGQNPVTGALVQILGFAAAFVAAGLLFGATYIIVPNRPVRLNEVWKGALVASALLVVYELVFPFYASNFLKPSHYGAIAGFAIVILVFFYYLAFILLLGAQVNSWSAGQRETAGPIEAILHEVQAHNTTRGAAGPTAGSPTEDIQNSKGSPAMRTTQAAVQHERQDHHFDFQPPKYAESGVTGSGYRQGQEGAARTSDATSAPEDAHGADHMPRQALPTQRTAWRPINAQVPAPPMTTRQRRALAATLAACAVALAPVARFIGRLIASDDHTPDATA